MVDATTFWTLLLTGLGTGGSLVGLGVTVLLRERRDERKIRQLEDFLQVATTADEYTGFCLELNRRHSFVRVLAKTPGLLLPTERDLTPARRQLFAAIGERLNEGAGSYRLEYLFDLAHYRAALDGYARSGRPELLAEAGRMLAAARSTPNLTLKAGDTGATLSMMIGGRTEACIGHKEKRAQWNTEGIRVHAPELVAMAIEQFDLLFERGADPPEVPPGVPPPPPRPG